MPQGRKVAVRGNVPAGVGGRPEEGAPERVVAGRGGSREGFRAVQVLVGVRNIGGEIAASNSYREE